MDDGEKVGKVTKLAQLGGPLRINKDTLWMHFGTSEGGDLKEKLFGGAGRGPLHPGMPYSKREVVAVGATMSDTRVTLVRELTEQSGLTRREAEDVVSEMLESGKLVEIEHGSLGRVLIWKG